jgi:hypothetical protein
MQKKFYLSPKFGTLINKKWITISELLQTITWKSQRSFEKKLQNPEPTRKYLTVETVVAQCGRQQS